MKRPDAEYLAKIAEYQIPMDQPARHRVLDGAE
jgi:hypothetical protein